METLPEQKNVPIPTVPATKSKLLRFWLPGIALLVVLLMAVLLWKAEHVLSSSSIKEKIQQTLFTATGIGIDYEKIGIRYFPAPSLELHQLTFFVPHRVQGKANTLRVSPNIAGLVSGKLGLGKIELDGPDVDLALTGLHRAEYPQETDVELGTEGTLNKFVATFFAVVPALHLNIVDGRFSIAFGSQVFTGERLHLRLDGMAENARSGRVALQLNLDQLAIKLGQSKEILEGVQLKGDVRMVDGDITCQLDHLVLANPALSLAGRLTMSQVDQGLTLGLSGTNINVNATRKAALALAGDVAPVTETFTYLTGGTVSQIGFTAKGNGFAELGDLKNLRIEGHLQNGVIALPEIDMHLTNVSGEVVIADGVLTGTNLQAQSTGATGYGGLLKIGLAEEDDRFQLELMLNADLGQVQPIVKRLIENPNILREIDRITNLKGTGMGKLILGDSLTDINAMIVNADVNLSCNYQKVPYPISITNGMVNMRKDQVELQGVNATVGKSEVSGLGVVVNWAKNVRLDISAKRSRLSLDELFPWLNSINNLRMFFKTVQDVSGRLELSSANFAGDVGSPQRWNYAAAGAVSGVNLKVNDVPGAIKLTKGNFQLDQTHLNMQGLVAEGLDATLTLNGIVSGFSSQSEQKVDVTVAGTMGKDSVQWLQGTLELPKSYVIRTPVILQGVRVSGRPKQDVSISGGITVKDGPQLTLDIQYQPRETRGEKLTVKDQFSEADITFLSKNDSLQASFNGRLRSETLVGLLVSPKWGKGDFQGDFSVDLPQRSANSASAKGSLKGINVSIPLASDEEVSVGQILLEADGAKVKAAANSLSWRNFTWDPLVATISFNRDTYTIKVDRAALCGVDSPGVVHITGEDFDLDVTLQGKNLDIATSYSCLTQGRVKMTGKMDFLSQIKAKGDLGKLVGKLEGPLKMTFRQGVIEQNRILSTLLEVLNVTEIVKGRLPNLATKGFQYTIITVEGHFKNGKLFLDNIFVDGETLDILGFGEIDIEKESVHLELLASPFKTVNTVIKYMPGINYLMGGSLVVIPVSVNGALANPSVSILSPSSVSKGLLNLGTRVFKLPYKMMESIIMGGEEAGKAIF